MIPITKQEASDLRKKFPQLTISRTMRQRTSRGRYFVEESGYVLRFLENLRSKNVVERLGVNG